MHANILDRIYHGIVHSCISHIHMLCNVHTLLTDDKNGQNEDLRRGICQNKEATDFKWDPSESDLRGDEEAKGKNI